MPGGVLHGHRGQTCSLSLFSGAVQLWWSSLSLPSISPSLGHGSLSPALPHVSLGGRGAVAVCCAVALLKSVAGDEGLEAAGSDEPGRSDYIPGRASCLARSPEARGKAGVLRRRVSAFATGIREIQAVLQSNLRWPGHGSACLARMRQSEVGGSALDAKAAGGCAVWAPATTVGTNPAAAPPGLGRGKKPSVFLLQ